MKVLAMVACVAFSAMAQVSLRRAGLVGRFSATWFAWLLASALSYGGSFACYAVVLRHYPLSRVSPVLTVAVMLIVVVAGVLMGECVSPRQWLGIALGVATIVLLST